MSISISDLTLTDFISCCLDVIASCTFCVLELSLLSEPKPTVMIKKKSTSKSQTPKLVSVPASEIAPFGRTFILNDATLIPEPALAEDAELLVLPHLPQEEAQVIVFANRNVLFGEQTIGLGVRGNDKPFPFKAYLFDFRQPEKPRLYLLAIETSLTPMMLSLIGLNRFLAEKATKENLLVNLASLVSKDKRFTKAIAQYVSKERPVELLLQTAVQKGLRGLCVFNSDEKQDEVTVSSYLNAHAGYIDLLFLRLYKLEKQTILSMIPSFDELITETPEPKKDRIVHTEEYHLENASELSRTIYTKLKTETLKLDKSLVMNPRGKHYISLRREGSKNLAFFHFRKSGIYLVVMLKEQEVRKLVKKSEVKSLPESVQSFWNGASTGLVISSIDHLKEVVGVIKRLIKK